MSQQGDRRETEAMARAAVDRAAGTMEAFWADTFVTDGLLRYISERAFLLKSLQLSLCYNVTNEGLAEAIKGFPQLEELDMTFCSLYGNVCESVGKACPQLKSFRLNRSWTDEGMGDDIEALGIASNMPELQDLQLIGNNLTNDGLMAILDRCPHLESLDIRQCYNIQMDDALKSKCARLRNLKLPGDSISDFKYQAFIADCDFDDMDSVISVAYMDFDGVVKYGYYHPSVGIDDADSDFDDMDIVSDCVGIDDADSDSDDMDIVSDCVGIDDADSDSDDMDDFTDTGSDAV